jgi:small-conductance mechanosensitive channel
MAALPEHAAKFRKLLAIVLWTICVGVSSSSFVHSQGQQANPQPPADTSNQLSKPPSDIPIETNQPELELVITDSSTPGVQPKGHSGGGQIRRNGVSNASATSFEPNRFPANKMRAVVSSDAQLERANSNRVPAPLPPNNPFPVPPPIVIQQPVRNSSVQLAIPPSQNASPQASVPENTGPQSAATIYTSAIAPAHLNQKHEDVSSELQDAINKEEKSNTGPASETTRTETGTVGLLKQIDVIVAQQQSATSQLEDIDADLLEMQVTFDKLQKNELQESPPYSITLLDEVRDLLAQTKLKLDATESSLMSALESVENAVNTSEEQRQALYQVRQSNPDPNSTAVQTAELNARLADEALLLQKQELEIETKSQATHELTIQALERKLDLLRDRVQFDSETLDRQIVEIDNRDAALKLSASDLSSEIRFIESLWLAARKELDSDPDPAPEIVEKTEALKLEEKTLQSELDAINQRRQRLPDLKNAWKRRFLVATGQASREERREWLADSKKLDETLQRERRSRELKTDEIRASLASVDAKLESLTAEQSDIKRWIESKRKSFGNQLKISGEAILAIENSRRVLNRLIIQIDGERSRSLGEWIDDIWAATKRIWNFPILPSEEYTLSVGRVLTGILFLVFGYFAARWISGLVGRRLPNLGIDEAGAYAIQSLSFYVLLIAFSLTALKYANIPLTVFTFLGGAIAIGVGFGSQNILNNFISGLILLAERPIKVGDLIHIDDTYGNVTQIGARSTQIRTGENFDIVVPNSKFLENNVVNLTRKDDKLRTSILVGVAYGSPLEEVIRGLEKSASDCPLVLDRPKPFVWFNDFGDNSLAFQVHFWITARTVAQMRKVETEVRLAIDRSFREAGITIAFPQRDLHLQTPKPLDFRIVGDDSGEMLRRSS